MKGRATAVRSLSAASGLALVALSVLACGREADVPEPAARSADSAQRFIADTQMVVDSLGNELMIVSNFGTTIRIDADSVSRQGRAAQGVRVMNLRSGDSVSAIAKVISSRSTDADGATDELTLDELSGESQTGTSTAGLPEPDGNGAVPGA